MKFLNYMLQNFSILCLIIGVCIIIICNKNFDRKMNAIFLSIASIIIVLIVESIIDLHLSSLTKPSFWRYIVSAVGYTLRPCVIVLLIMISLRGKKFSFVLWVPIILLAIIAFTDYFTHLMFWYDERNWFRTGPLTYLAHYISAIYLILFLLTIIKRRKNTTHTEIFAILFSVLICLLATILETLLSGYRFLITDAMGVSMTLYYIVLYAETFRRDVLTGLLNRRSLYISINKKSNKTLVVISVDLNCLKEINDTKGHLAGDQALKNLADTLLEESKKDYIPYRTGGDEFIVIGKGKTNTEIDEFIDNIRIKLKDKKIMASFGYVLYRPGDSFDDVCNKADENMYKDKRNYKSRFNS